MRLIAKFIDTQAKELLDSNVRLRIIGRRDRIAGDLRSAIQVLEKLSSKNAGLNLTVALDYGGRQDIAGAALAIAKEIEAGMLTADDLNDDLLKSRMSTRILPPVDLLIRTGGEKRLSNFLLWDLSYAELFLAKNYGRISPIVICLMPLYRFKDDSAGLVVVVKKVIKRFVLL